MIIKTLIANVIILIFFIHCNQSQILSKKSERSLTMLSPKDSSQSRPPHSRSVSPVLVEHPPEEEPFLVPSELSENDLIKITSTNPFNVHFHPRFTKKLYKQIAKIAQLSYLKVKMFNEPEQSSKRIHKIEELEKSFKGWQKGSINGETGQPLQFLPEWLNSIRWSYKKPDLTGLYYESPDHQQIIFGFHGSQDTHDWHDNGSFLPTRIATTDGYIDVHGGFGETAMSTRFKKDFFQILSNLDRYHQQHLHTSFSPWLNFTGHSKGGAIAILQAALAHYYLKEYFKENPDSSLMHKIKIHVITFSAPPLFSNENNAREIEALLGYNNIIRINTPYDPVPGGIFYNIGNLALDEANAGPQRQAKLKKVQAHYGIATAESDDESESSTDLLSSLHKSVQSGIETARDTVYLKSVKEAHYAPHSIGFDWELVPEWSELFTALQKGHQQQTRKNQGVLKKFRTLLTKLLEKIPLTSLHPSEEISPGEDP